MFCFRKINAGHFSQDCSIWKGPKAKREEVSIVDGYVVRRDTTPSQSDDEVDAYSSVPVITIPGHIQSATIDSGVDCGATITVVSPHMVKKHNLVDRPAPPVKICQAMDPKGSIYNRKVISTVALPDKSSTSVHKHEFTITPLSNHDALLGMPFLATEGVLIDPANRSLLLPAHMSPSADSVLSPTTDSLINRPDTLTPDGYVRVGNALMKNADHHPTVEDLVECNELVQSLFSSSIFAGNLQAEERTPK